jgi:hypothetical protein
MCILNERATFSCVSASMFARPGMEARACRTHHKGVHSRLRPDRFERIGERTGEQGIRDHSVDPHNPPAVKLGVTQAGNAYLHRKGGASCRYGTRETRQREAPGVPTESPVVGGLLL